MLKSLKRRSPKKPTRLSRFVSFLSFYPFPGVGSTQLIKTHTKLASKEESAAKKLNKATHVHEDASISERRAREAATVHTYLPLIYARRD